MAKPDKTYTIEGFIESGKGVTLTYQRLSLVNEIGEKIKFPFKNVFNDYLPDIENSALIHVVEIPNDKFVRYQYRPKLLSYDIYGTTDLDFVIMALNRIISPKDFSLKMVKVIRKQDLNELLSSIYNAEKDLIKKFK